MGGRGSSSATSAQANPFENWRVYERVSYPRGFGEATKEDILNLLESAGVTVVNPDEFSIEALDSIIRGRNEAISLLGGSAPDVSIMAQNRFEFSAPVAGNGTVDFFSKFDDFQADRRIDLSRDAFISAALNGIGNRQLMSIVADSTRRFTNSSNYSDSEAFETAGNFLMYDRAFNYTPKSIVFTALTDVNGYRPNQVRLLDGIASTFKSRAWNRR